MDLSELLPRPDNNIGITVLTTMACVLIIVALAAAIIGMVKKGFGIIMALVAASAFFLAGVGLVAADSIAGDTSDHDAILAAKIFSEYGLASLNPDGQWESLEKAGATGVATAVRRGEAVVDVLLRVEGTRLVITGADGVEIPTSAQLNAEGGK